ncbi:uncharacterized protein LOC111333559 [Stylophora pistillata]|uniref:uncharacterized protein LOC111333559 n=1 Tax=Stylophora pistillata TaxID=50429 RepID=UPI000C03A96C|nr:uncharacterized protein LOC111333559 [Stylophora pistillata]XP_022794894.1 uncharacterized protein LOC111333559 [Stylophora pistillata]
MAIFCSLVLFAMSFDVAWCFVHVTASSSWPAGSYALPMADSGCPESSGFTWYTGHRTEELENDSNKNARSPRIHLKADIGKPEITRRFCVKNSTATDKGKPKWPNGKFCIYKEGDFCPQGFYEGLVRWDDDNKKNGSNRNHKGGKLPAGVYNQDTLIYFCCKTTGFIIKRIALPVSKPFYLMAFGSKTCQEVQGAVYSLEYVVFDTENTNNMDSRVYPYPYGADRKEPTIHYCYYRECKWNLNQTSGEFSSPYFPSNYHNFQDCQWNITAPRDHVIRLQFGVLKLESDPSSCGNDRCGCDYVDIQQESVTGHVTTLGRFCATILSLPIIQSSTNKMIVTFHSDHAITAKGFNASYTIVQKSTEITSTAATETASPMYNTSQPTSPSVKTIQQSTLDAKESNITPPDATLSTMEVTETARDETTENVQATLRERQISTSQVPASNEAEWKSTQSIHDVQSYGNEELLSRKVMGVPLKYIIIASGSCVVLFFFSFLLVCQLCKRRHRLRKRRNHSREIVRYSNV